MWLMKTLLTSGCTNQRGAGHRHYVITEDSVIASWPSRSDKESEIIQLNDGRIITANNVRRFNFIDISKIESLTAIDDGIVF